MTSKVTVFGSFFAAYVNKGFTRNLFSCDFIAEKTLISVTSALTLYSNCEVCKILATFFSIWTFFQSTVLLALKYNLMQIIDVAVYNKTCLLQIFFDKFLSTKQIYSKCHYLAVKYLQGQFKNFFLKKKFI